MNNFTDFVLLNEASDYKTNCLPIDLSSVPNKYRLLCMDDHALKIILTSLGNNLVGGLISAAISRSMSLVLPTVLIYMGISLIPVLAKFDAKDFRLVPKDLKEDFDSTDDGYKVKIVAINDGVVEDINNSVRDNDNSQGHGNFILISHTFGDTKFYSLYTRLKHKSIKVDKGDKVKKGQYIANMGNTGDEEHLLSLHFEMNRIPFMLGKFTENFESHKYSPLNLRDICSGESPIFKDYINNKLIMNNNGNIDNFCFLT